MKSIQIFQYKSEFIQALQPFFEMLKDQRSIVSYDDWLKLVNNLVNRVIQDPQQYLENDLPSSEIITEIVKEIFQEFIHQHTSKKEETYR